MTDCDRRPDRARQFDCPERAPALDAFYAKWKDEALVVDKWLGVQAISRLPGHCRAVQALTAHPAFTLKNPNKVCALIGSFCGNQVTSMLPTAAGYALWPNRSLRSMPSTRRSRHAWRATSIATSAMSLDVAH